MCMQDLEFEVMRFKLPLTHWTMRIFLSFFSSFYYLSLSHLLLCLTLSSLHQRSLRAMLWIFCREASDTRFKWLHADNHLLLFIDKPLRISAFRRSLHLIPLLCENNNNNKTQKRRLVPFDYLRLLLNYFFYLKILFQIDLWVQVCRCF